MARLLQCPKVHRRRRSAVRLDESTRKCVQDTVEGILKSTVFPGLWLDAAVLLEGKLSQVLAVLDRGIKSPEHAAFVAKLAK